MLNLVPEEFDDIVAVSKEQKGDKDYHTCYLGIFHEFIAWLFTGYYLKKKEHYMSTVESRYWKNIHYRQDDREECCEVPECLPVP